MARYVNLMCSYRIGWFTINYAVAGNDETRSTLLKITLFSFLIVGMKMKIYLIRDWGIIRSVTFYF